jgi:hypothetical protein
MRGGLTKGERTLREDWLVDGGWRCTGKGMGIEREREREGWGERGQESKVSAGIST